MAFALTEKSFLQCAHSGTVGLDASQDFVTVDGVLALVKPDLLDRPIAACPHATPSTPPCTKTVAVDESPAYSAFVTIGGKALCKDTATGRTNWSQLNIVPFGVTSARQELLAVSE
ncbi:hypothetical protein OU426_01635 [Frigidibacter sp. RF13]|uniref:hypothetical protein n=1 Tax=Frigidibacter sp. RF13 TaxID=2997340 RepID=UPI002270D2CA|nr:hypothetical protein [Frigidibacter sp. RF13]MCY1125542.1 hypothetical protein [Frigidibacter sp. RF13]